MDVRRHAFGGARAGDLLDRVGDEVMHLAGARAPNADAAPPSGIAVAHRFRFRVCDLEYVVAVDVDAARPAELLPLGDVAAVLVENLDAVVVAVADKQPPLRIHRQRMGDIELARACALFAPGLDELAVA